MGKVSPYLFAMDSRLTLFALRSDSEKRALLWTDRTLYATHGDSPERSMVTSLHLYPIIHYFRPQNNSRSTLHPSFSTVSPTPAVLSIATTSIPLLSHHPPGPVRGYEEIYRQDQSLTPSRAELLDARILTAALDPSK